MGSRDVGRRDVGRARLAGGRLRRRRGDATDGAPRSEAGILSVAEAGELDLATIDPERDARSAQRGDRPFYGYVRAGHAGPDRRARAGATVLAATGFIDEASYDLASARGRIRAVDGIAYLAQAQLPDGAALPNTLRARVRAIVAARRASAARGPRRARGADRSRRRSAGGAARRQERAGVGRRSPTRPQDALVYVWVDPTGHAPVPHRGARSPTRRSSIGCPPADADPGDLWLEGSRRSRATAAGDASATAIRAYSSGTTGRRP